MPTPSNAFAPVRLEARDPARNIARRYSILISEDLFGATLVDLAWGRIGTSGQQKRHSFDGLDQANVFVARVLRQRAGAIDRIGVPYRPVSG